MLKTLLKLSLLFRRCRKSELKVDKNLLNQNVDSIENSVGRAIKQYENHPSIKGIERNVESRIFFFCFELSFCIEQKLKKMNPKKASQDTDIPTRILKENSDFSAQFILKN